MQYEPDSQLDNVQPLDADEDQSVPEFTEPSDPNDPDAFLAMLDNPHASLREQAFTLYCHGFRSAAIAAAIGVNPRTIRRWLSDMRTLIAAEARADRAAELLRAIESHRAIAGAAWEAYEHERQLERQILSGELDHIRRRARHVGAHAGGRPRIHPPIYPPVPSSPDPAFDTPDSTDATGAEETVLEEIERPALPRQGARFLVVALAAQREVARLQGLYDHLQRERPPVHVLITEETTDENGQPTTVTYGQIPSDTVENSE